MKAKGSLSLMQRIRSAISSLENAEQSFKENQAVRGELDLMLAEAELKTLRKKGSLPWNWNRQLLALSAACLLLLAGFGGWCWAQGGLAPAEGEASQEVATQELAPAQTQEGRQAGVQEVEQGRKKVLPQQAGPSKTRLSEEEMRVLVRSARTWLHNSK